MKQDTYINIGWHYGDNTKDESDRKPISELPQNIQRILSNPDIFKVTIQYTYPTIITYSKDM